MGGCFALIVALTFAFVCFVIEPILGLTLGLVPLGIVIYLDWRHR